MHLKLGEYSKSQDARSIASEGIFLGNILRHGCAFICGNLKSLQLGFIRRSSLVGVPSTFIICTSWSTTFSLGNNGWPKRTCID